MFPTTKGLARLALVASLGLVLVGCGTVGSDESAPPEAPSAYDSATPSPSDGKADIVVPDHVGQRPRPTVPPAFPVLTEEIGVASYLKTMFDIHAVALKNPQDHEWDAPSLVAVTGSEDCRLDPNQSGAAQQIGDNAKPYKSAPVPEIAACYKGNKLVIKYGPKMMYRLRTDYANRDILEGAIRNAYGVYLVAKVKELNGNDDDLVRACARGRMIGGLRDKNYILPQKANSIDQPSEGEWNTVFTTARETGKCSAKLLGK